MAKKLKRTNDALFGALLGLVIIMLPALSISAPKVELWPRWTERGGNSAARIELSAWQISLDSDLREDSGGINRFDDVAMIERDFSLEDIEHRIPRPVWRIQESTMQSIAYHSVTVTCNLAHLQPAT